MSQSELKAERLPAAPVLKPVLFGVLTLISGIAIGAGLTLILTSNSDERKPLPDVRMVERITRELNLTPEQKEQIGPIVQKHMKVMDDIRKEARPKIMAELEQMNDGIMAILDEGQKQIWQDKIKRMQDLFKQLHQRRGPGDGRRSGRDPNSPPRRGERRPGERFRERPPEGPLPPKERPPIDGTTPPR